MALKVKSFYPTNIVIDGEIIPIRIKRMDPNESLRFNQQFAKLGASAESTDPDAEAESKIFVVDAITKFVNVEPDNIFCDDNVESVVSGAEVCRLFGARDEVLSELLLHIFMENKLNAEQKTNWKTKLAPFVPTPTRVADRMMENAAVTADDLVYDLGCGDGALVIAAAKRGARAVGFDTDPERIAAANKAAKEAGVEELATFEMKDALTVDLSKPSVVSIYLLTGANAKLRPLFAESLPAGARVVSHAFPLGGGWEPDSSVYVAPEEGEDVAHSGARWVYTYSVDRHRAKSS